MTSSTVLSRNWWRSRPHLFVGSFRLNYFILSQESKNIILQKGLSHCLGLLLVKFATLCLNSSLISSSFSLLIELTWPVPTTWCDGLLNPYNYYLTLLPGCLLQYYLKGCIQSVPPPPHSLPVSVVGLKHKEMKLWRRIIDQINLPIFVSVLRFSISFWRTLQIIENHIYKWNGHAIYKWTVQRSPCSLVDCWMCVLYSLQSN